MGPRPILLQRRSLLLSLNTGQCLFLTLIVEGVLPYLILKLEELIVMGLFIAIEGGLLEGVVAVLYDAVVYYFEVFGAFLLLETILFYGFWSL